MLLSNRRLLNLQWLLMLRLADYDNGENFTSTLSHHMVITDSSLLMLKFRLIKTDKRQILLLQSFCWKNLKLFETARYWDLKTSGTDAYLQYYVLLYDLLNSKKWKLETCKCINIVLLSMLRNIESTMLNNCCKDLF